LTLQEEDRGHESVNCHVQITAENSIESGEGLRLIIIQNEIEL